MSDRQRLLSEAFASYAQGDLGPFRRLFDAGAKWVAVPQGRPAEATPTCADRSQIVDLLGRHYGNGRRFSVEEMIEQDDRVAVRIVVMSPEWSAPVSMFKVFTFRHGESVVVRLNDCIDESYALQILAA